MNTDHNNQLNHTQPAGATHLGRYSGVGSAAFLRTEKMTTRQTDQNLDWLGAVEEQDQAETQAYSVHAYDGKEWFTAAVTTDHASSSYGQPVLVHIRTGIAYGTAEVTIRMRSNVHAYNEARAAGYCDAPGHIK